MVRVDTHPANELPPLLLRLLGSGLTLPAPGRRLAAVGRLRTARAALAPDRQVADVSDARLDEVVAPQVPVDGPGLGGDSTMTSDLAILLPVTTAVGQSVGRRKPALR